MSGYWGLLVWWLLPVATQSWSLQTPIFHPNLLHRPPSRALTAAKKLLDDTASLETTFDITNNSKYHRFAAFLAEEIGMTDLARVNKIAEKAPNILNFTEPVLKRRFDLFRDMFQYSNEELQQIIYRCGSTFLTAPKTLRTKIEQFSQTLLIDNDLEAVGVILLKQPNLLSMDMKKNVKPKVKYLRERVFQNDNNAMLIAMGNNPSVLTRSLDNRIIPRTEALLAAGISPSHHFRMSYITTDAQFQAWFERKTGSCLSGDWRPKEQSTLSQQERYQERIELFSTKLGMATEEVTHVLHKWPKVQGSTLDNLTAKIDGIIRIYCGSKHDASQAIQTLPQMLTLSLEKNLQPKAEYLREYVFSKDDDAFLDAITKSPAIVGSYSLENRIRPRIEDVIAAGLNLKDIDVVGAITKPDNQFATWLENRKKELEDQLW